MSPWDEHSVLRGSPLYMAPEMVCRRQYDSRVDLWSVGVILYGECCLHLFLNKNSPSKMNFTSLHALTKQMNPLLTDQSLFLCTVCDTTGLQSV